MLPRPVAVPAFGLACLLGVGVLGVSAAAATPSGLLLGLPSWPGAIVVCCLVSGVALLGDPDSRSLGVGLLPFLLAPWLSPFVPGLAAWTGPALLAPFVAVGLVMAEGWSGRRTSRQALVPVLFVVYALAAGRAQMQVGPEGDEPHYLMLADSLLRDGDLSLERDYAESRYLLFYDKGPLAPHYRVRGKGGEIYSLHALGLSLLVLPAYAFGGYPAVSFFMALLLALTVREIRRLLEVWLRDAPAATAVAWLVGLSPPLIHYAGLVFTEVPAGLLLALALRLGSSAPPTGLKRSLGVALAVGFLPWLNVRYALLSGLALLHALSYRPPVRVVAALASVAAVSAGALCLYHDALYGFYDPSRVYGPRPELALAQLAEGLPGLLLDQEFGLLVYAPVFVLALPGLLWFARRRLRSGLTGLALVLSVVVVSGSWHMWRGGFNPPARFLVPVVPVLAVGLGQLLRQRWRFAPALLAGWGLWIGAAGAWDPRLVHRDRDGTAPFFRAQPSAEEWTRLLPGYVLGEPDRHGLSIVWGLALATVAAAAFRRQPPRVASVALASTACLVASVCATLVSGGRAVGREAVHLVGRPALELPSLRAFARSPGVWSVRDLVWGPTYEPHRHPAGAAIGERLGLAAGRYVLTLRAERLGDPVPALLVRVEGRPASTTSHPTRPSATGLEAEFGVPPGAGPVTLSLLGGAALVLDELRLERSTFRP